MATVDLGNIKFNWKNVWTTSTAYIIDDCVRDTAGSYICITAHTSHASDASLVTSDSAYWNQMAQAGAADPTMGGDLTGTASNAQIAAGVVGTTEIATDAVTANEIVAGAVGTTEIATNAVTVNELATTLDLSSNTVIVPAATVTDHVQTVDVTAILDNIALLGLKAAAGGALARYNLIDQVIDEFTDNSGIDTANTVGGNVSGYWSGQAEIPTGFAYTGADQTLTLNANTSTIDFWLWGASSGSGASGWGGYWGSGSGGGATTGTIAGTMPATLKIMVGAGGGAPSDTQQNNYGHAGQNNSPGYTGNGGGLSGIFKGDTNNQADMIACAGGAGGGGCGWNSGNIQGGVGGGTNGGNGGYGGGSEMDRGGKGGSQSAAGAGGTHAYNTDGAAGSGMHGGTAPAYGGSGGGGYWGGGSGSYSEGHDSQRNMTGGGGGSGFVNTTGVSGTTATGTLYSGNSQAPGLEGHTKLPVNVGYGAGTVNTAGQNGYVEVLEKINENGVFISNATTATTQPTSADLIMLYSDGAGTAVLNTDLKGYVSRDDGTTWAQATLVAQSIAGGQTVILAHDIDVSSQPAGTSMRWKVTTHNQGISLDTRLHGVSLGWG